MALKIIRRKFSETLPAKAPKATKTDAGKIPSPEAKAGAPTKTTKKSASKKRAITEPLAMNPDQRIVARIARREPRPSDQGRDTHGEQQKEEARGKAEPEKLNLRRARSPHRRRPTIN
jgi:hypothetical protein